MKLQKKTHWTIYKYVNGNIGCILEVDLKISTRTAWFTWWLSIGSGSDKSSNKYVIPTQHAFWPLNIWSPMRNIWSRFWIFPALGDTDTVSKSVVFGLWLKLSLCFYFVELQGIFWVLRHVRLKLFKRAWSAGLVFGIGTGMEFLGLWSCTVNPAIGQPTVACWTLDSQLWNECKTILL